MILLVASVHSLPSSSTINPMSSFIPPLFILIWKKDRERLRIVAVRRVALVVVYLDYLRSGSFRGWSLFRHRLS